jgi:hypothetical protein
MKPHPILKTVNFKAGKELTPCRVPSSVHYYDKPFNIQTPTPSFSSLVDHTKCRLQQANPFGIKTAIQLQPTQEQQSLVPSSPISHPKPGGGTPNLNLEPRPLTAAVSELAGDC